MKKAKSPSNRYKENQPFLNNTFYHTKQHKSPNLKNAVFYNEFMQQQRSHPKTQNPRIERRPNTQFGSNLTRQSLINTQQQMNKILVFQNQLLLNELLHSQLRENKYKEKIRQLKIRNKVKNHQDLTFREQENYKNIGIQDKDKEKEKQNSANILQRQSSRVIISARTMQTQEAEGTLRSSQLNESIQYIKHTERSIENQIQQLNDKLCRLLQSTSCESNKELKFKQRIQMSQCVKELKQLRQCYQSIKS